MNTIYSTPVPYLHYRIELAKLMILVGATRNRKVYAAIACYDLLGPYGTARHHVARYYNWQLLEGVGADNAKILTAPKCFLTGGVQ